MLDAATINPFDQLVRLAQGRRARRRMPRVMTADKVATKTGALLGFLREAGPSSTLTLGSLIEADSHVVWGLLKSRRDLGQVRFEEGMWSIVEEFDEQQHEQIRIAAALLRRHGWNVRPPAATAPRAHD